MLYFNISKNHLKLKYIRTIFLKPHKKCWTPEKVEHTPFSNNMNFFLMICMYREQYGYNDLNCIFKKKNKKKNDATYDEVGI